MLAEIPVELLQSVASEVSTTGLKALRAVSKHLRAVVEPIFCESTTLILDVREWGPSQLDVLAAGPTSWSFCRHLNIRSLAVVGGTDGTYQYRSTHKILRPALESLTALRSVRWTIGYYDPEWAQNVVFQVLDEREHIQELSLTNAGARFLALGRISYIRNLKFEDEPPSTGDFLHWMQGLVRSTLCLESLSFPTGAFAPMRETLEQEKIWLKSVFVQHCDLALLQYLASYSGLERLQISDYVHRDEQGRMLFNTVLPKHAASLVVLICPGYREGPCSFGRDNISLISSMQRLERLEISVNASEIANGKGDIVALFLEMAAEMPALRNIAIITTVSPMGGCGNAVSRAIQSAQERVGQAMDAFGRATGSDRISSLIETHHQRIRSINRYFY
ncbi:hypothetical protein DFH06DRAFT_1360822 [Mycena polygramma]|nr:hypothetical protein DFH06DRAFT_1360822 [Mycena polygramma]